MQWQPESGERVAVPVYMGAYVDDITIVAPMSLMKGLFDELAVEFTFRDPPEPLTRLLGIRYVTKTGSRGERILEFDQEEFALHLVHDFEKGCAKLPRAITPALSETPPKPETEWLEEKGLYADAAPHWVGRLLYLSRGSRGDICYAVVRLTRAVHRWTKREDQDLMRLVAFLKYKPGVIVMYRGSWEELPCLADSIFPQVVIHHMADADHAGDRLTRRSTSGYVTIATLEDAFPDSTHGKAHTLIDWGAKGQKAAAWSTGEAELGALNCGLRRSGIPSWMLFEHLTNQAGRATLRAYGDAQACGGAVQKGASPAMRYVQKTQGVRISWLHDVLMLNPTVTLQDIRTFLMLADMFTKALEQKPMELICGALGLRV